jgi:hypothetical protein
VEYQIADIGPGVGDNDLLVTLHVWYSDFDRGLGKKPDHIRHHTIENIPNTRPIVNEVGQFLGADGVWITPWELVDDEWVEVEVPASLLRLEDVPDDELESLITATVDDVALRIEKNRPRLAEDVFKPGEFKVNKKSSALGKRALVQAQRGKTKRVR